MIIYGANNRPVSQVKGPPVEMADGQSFDQFADHANTDLLSQGLSRRAVVLTDTQRHQDVGNSRTFFREDGPSKEIVRLYRSMAIGRGMGAASTDEDEAVQKTINKRIDELFTDQINRKSLSSKGQKRLANSLLVNGELFVVLFLGDKSNVTKVRILDVLEIDEIVADSEDADIPICYKRVSRPLVGMKTEGRLYFDAFADDASIEAVTAQVKATGVDGKNPFKDFKIQDPKKIRVLHVTIETITERGNSILLTCIYPAQAHRGFLTARNAIIRARTLLAWDEKIKGGPETIANRVSALQSTISQDDTRERNPPGAAGGVYVHNEGIERTPVKQDTQASDALIDNQIGIQAIGVGVGIQAEFLGAQNTSRLANGLADIITMAEAIGEFQDDFADLLSDIVEIDLISSGQPKDKASAIAISRKPIVKKDKEKDVKLLLEAIEKKPELAKSDIIILALLAALEIDDPAKALEEIRGIETEADDDGDDEDALSEINGANTVKMLTELKSRMAKKFGERNLAILTNAIANQHKDGDACCG